MGFLIQVQSTVNEYNDIARDIAINPFVSKYTGESTIELKFDHNQKDMSKSSLSDCRERLKVSQLIAIKSS